MPDPLTIALQRLARAGLPVPPATAAALRRRLADYTGILDEDIKQEVLQKLLDGIQSIAKPQTVVRDGAPVTVGETPASLTGDISKLLLKFEDGAAIADSLNLRFKIGVATQVLRGAGHFLTDQTDVDEYPAWELHRIYDRAVPRGMKPGPKGTLVEDSADAWDTDDGRWQAACNEAGDDDALKVFEDTGRMVALKSSGVWQALGDGAGGYDDTLGNPFAPFAWNSGYGTDGVPRQECVALGLLDEGETPEPAEIDFGKLFSLPG